MKTFLAGILLVILLVITSCTSPPKGREVIRKGDTTTVVERTLYYDLLENHDIYTCYQLNSSDMNSVDSINTTYIKDIPDIQEVYMYDGSIQIYVSYFEIKDLNLRKNYITYKNSQTTKELKYFSTVADEFKHYRIRNKYTDNTKDWLYFNSFLNNNGEKILSFKKYLVEVKGASYWEIWLGLPFTVTMNIIILISMLVLIVVVFSNSFNRRSKKTSEDTG